MNGDIVDFSTTCTLGPIRYKEELREVNEKDFMTEK